MQENTLFLQCGKWLWPFFLSKVFFRSHLYPRNLRGKKKGAYFFSLAKCLQSASPACSVHSGSVCLFCFGCSNLHSTSSPCVDIKVTLGSSCIFCKSGCKQVWITHVIWLCPPPSVWGGFFWIYISIRNYPFEDPISYFPASNKLAT